MYVVNNSRQKVNIFDLQLNPGDSHEFLFSDTVVDTRVSTDRDVIFSQKLPSNTMLRIDDNDVVVDDNLKFEYFDTAIISKWWWIFGGIVVAIIVFYILIRESPSDK
jgi:hypothetical protein